MEFDCFFLLIAGKSIYVDQFLIIIVMLGETFE